MKDFMGTYADHVYEIVARDCKDLDSIYEDYINFLVGTHGLMALVCNNLVESCGVVNGRRLYVLCKKEELDGKL